MKEKLPLRINHKDGTSTVFFSKEQGFGALKDESEKITEAEVQADIRRLKLPFNGRMGEIVGWGGFSVAARVKRDEDYPQIVGVIRPIAEKLPEGFPKLSGSWRIEQEIRKKFKPFTIPQHLIITQGLEGLPATVKIAHEVEGATMGELLPLGLLGNETLLKNFAKFCQAALSVFLAEGKLVDTSGHLTRTKLQHIWLGMVPLSSGNLMGEYGTNRLVLVDCDLKPEIHFFNQAKTVQKLGLIARAGLIAGTGGLTKGFLLAHKVRNKIFREHPTVKPAEKIRQTAEYSEFITGFRNIIEKLDREKVNYRVVGSFALAASIRKAGGDFFLPPRRSNGTIRDIDVLILEPRSSKLEGLIEYFARKRGIVKACPEVSFSMPGPVGKMESLGLERAKILPTTVSSLAVDREGKFCKIYKDLVLPFSEEHLRPVDFGYEGVEFPGLNAGVLAGLALIRGGSFKFKDLAKIEKLCKVTRCKIPCEFRDFAHQIRETYPTLYRNFLMREWMAYWTGGYLSDGQLTRIGQKMRQMVGGFRRAIAQAPDGLTTVLRR